MPVLTSHLIHTLNHTLRPQDFKDYCPNGLQVQGRAEIHKLITGVTASQALIDEAIAEKADAILVHHGYFWKNEAQAIVGMKYQRIKRLIEHGINLIAYHLPLDCHPELGNNAQLGKLLGLTDLAPLPLCKPEGLLYQGRIHSQNGEEQVSASELQQHIATTLDREVLWVGNHNKLSTLAWCTGGGQGYIEQAAAAGVDGFLSGEVSEQTVHIAREMGIHFFSAGHHATERYGVKALGQWLQDQLPIEVKFIDIANPA